jgi:hypothetical protein
VLEPGLLEVGYAAGFYEGEGSADCRDGALRVTLPQGNIEPLEYLRQYFGGNINGPCKDGMHYLYLYGKRAWNFLVLVSPLLSRRRLDQVVLACSKVPYYEGEEVVLCGEPLTGIN